jgi:hypothetical protein
MKPSKILGILLIVLAILGGISLIIPKEGIPLGGKLRLNFISWNELVSPDTVSYKDISSIIKNVAVISDSIVADSASTANTSIGMDTVRAIPDSLRKNLRPLEFPANDRQVLYSFFELLFHQKQKHELIRILHYGDSQIEGDRITSYIRDRMQRTFGGHGIGLFPVLVVNNYTIAFNHSASDNWKRYSLHDVRDTTINCRKSGVLANFARFGTTSDSLELQSWIRLSPSKSAFQRARQFSQLRIFYGENKQAVTTLVSEDETALGSRTLEPTSGLGVASWHFNHVPSNLTISFNGYDSPNIYALAFDDSTGIAVDNIPLRGSAGLEFNRMDLGLLKNMLRKLNVKLLILEFGVNVVPAEATDYGYYEKAFYSQLNTLKTIAPDVAIVVMGVSDMSRKVNENYVSYPNIEKIRDAQRNAAFKAGCAFWDTYKAMGGNNSMPSWVFADPPLAQKDFTHFSPAGARIIAEMFYAALISEYENYRRTALAQNIK